jgi:hypothetical protein
MVTVASTKWTHEADQSKAARLASLLLGTDSSAWPSEPLPMPAASDAGELDDVAGGES